MRSKVYEEHLIGINAEGSDKQYHGYLRTYADIFSTFPESLPICIAEVGVYQGRSIELWTKFCSRFFGGSTIIGIDINPVQKEYHTSGAKTIYVVRNAEDIDTWYDLPPIDIIIDDGSHVSREQISTLEVSFRKLKEGGYYVIEDTHTDYWPHFQVTGAGKLTSYIQDLAQQIQYNGNGCGDMYHQDCLIDRHATKWPASEIESIMIRKSMIIIKKART